MGKSGYDRLKGHRESHNPVFEYSKGQGSDYLDVNEEKKELDMGFYGHMGKPSLGKSSIPKGIGQRGMMKKLPK